MKIQGKSSLKIAVAAAALCVGTLGAATIYVRRRHDLRGR